ncbi:putative amino acid racemase [Vibrio sp. ES.051]|uniref:alanine racemase n=1 Tax=Vibrio sp. ES.051 TaxID=1761909 RepID=UPI000BF258D0|nr:alanine racemase [Vibrio sp. ES.051]PFG58345.1 putative amino acid racemase [Vibrio sp. ES.051]
MFLDALIKQNSALIDATLQMHHERTLYPDTYVIDVDTFIDNATQLKKQADRIGIKLYGMTKQVGRNPYLANKLIEIGYEGIVAVDYYEALSLHSAGIKVAHVGHLVQPPEAMLESIVSDIRPEVVTIYSFEKAQRLSYWAQKHEHCQKILLKFCDQKDHLYTNQEAGFQIGDIQEVVQKISMLPNIEIGGVTHFPCFLAHGEAVAKTNNLSTLLKASDYLTQVGFDNHYINAPSLTCSATLPISGELGCTHCEPGHALTGTIPINQTGSQPEKVAMLYLSEVSHQFESHSYLFGGGYYRRGNLMHALVKGAKIAVTNDDTDSIDYHLKLKGHHPIGTPAIMAFRTQVFTTRSRVALIEGLSQGKAQLQGIYTSTGETIHG